MTTKQYQPTESIIQVYTIGIVMDKQGMPLPIEEILLIADSSHLFYFSHIVMVSFDGGKP